MISGQKILLRGCILLVGLFGVPHSKATDLDDTIKMIMEASERVSFQGVMTQIQVNSVGDTLRFSQRLTHQRPARDRIDVLEPDSERGVVMIRIDGEIYRRESVADTLVYSRRSQFGLDMLDMGMDFSSFDLLRTNYTLTLSESDSMLGRDTFLLTLTPRHPGRLTKKAWLDTQTGLVLHTQYCNESGTTVEEVYFTSLQINPLIDPDLFDTREWKGKSVEVNKVIACGSYAEVQEKAGFPLAAPVYLPPGFTLDRLRVLRYMGQPLVHFMYTDGVARLSLFERVSPPDNAAPVWPDGPAERKGNVYIWKRPPYTILRRNENGRLCTIVSPIGSAESMKMIESLCLIQTPEDKIPFSGSLPWMAGGGAGILLIAGWLLWRRHSLG
ncbi:MAG: hypothetical protein FJY97_18595 [candidate division Zixibacteria bacterium]|nr:hypothetical protein [candidate division Zixibacteria bacterium]